MSSQYQHHPVSQGGTNPALASGVPPLDADDGQIWAQRTAGPIPAWHSQFPSTFVELATHRSIPSSPTAFSSPSLPQRYVVVPPKRSIPFGPFSTLSSPPVMVEKILNHLPPDFPPHSDSIQAELFPHLRADLMHLDPNLMLHALRTSMLSAHQYDHEEMPTMFSYARARGYKPSHSSPFLTQSPLTVTRFGVTAPRAIQETSQIADEVRAYRVRKCWGTANPPKRLELWNHGNCAEAQSIPAVVAWCELLELEDVVIESLAMHKFGKDLLGMCKNCLSYVAFVLRRHPSWKVVDVHTKHVFVFHVHTN